MKVKMKRILSILLAAAALMSLLTVGVAALEQLDLRNKPDLNLLMKYRDEDGELHPVEGRVGLYCIALTRIVNADQFFVQTAQFMAADIDLSEVYTEEELLRKVPVPILLDYIHENNLSPKDDKIATIDENGLAHFQDLSAGLYLVVPLAPDGGPLKFSMNPFLLTLPRHFENGSYDYDCLIPMEPKTEITPGVVDIHVTKVWAKDKVTDRPESITVDLMNGSQVADTAVLNMGNQWSWTFTDKPIDVDWTVQEHKVKGYKSEVSELVLENGVYEVVITNTFDPTEKLEQTGQLNWPVPVLLIGGLLLVACGFVMSRDKKKY